VASNINSGDEIWREKNDLFHPRQKYLLNHLL